MPVTQLIQFREYSFDDPFSNILKSDADGVLENIVATSLFSDALVDAGEIPEYESDRRGWWADTYTDDNFGSKLWLHDRSVVTDKTLKEIKDYVEKSLLWMIDQGIAKDVKIIILKDKSDRVLIGVEVEKNDGDKIKIQYSNLWVNN